MLSAELNFGYVSRIRNNISVTARNGESRTATDSVTAGGRVRTLRDATGDRPGLTDQHGNLRHARTLTGAKRNASTDQASRARRANNATMLKPLSFATWFIDRLVLKSPRQSAHTPRAATPYDTATSTQLIARDQLRRRSR